MQDPKSSNSGLDPLAELQRILSQDDPFKVFDKQPNVPLQREFKPIIARTAIDNTAVNSAHLEAVRASVEHIPQSHQPQKQNTPSIEELELQLKSLAHDIESNFNFSATDTAEHNSAKDNVSAVDVHDKILPKIFNEDVQHHTSGLRGAMELPIVKSPISTADTIRMFDEMTDQISPPEELNSVRISKERRMYSPIMSEQRDSITKDSAPSTGIKIIFSVIAVALVGVAVLWYLSLQSNSSSQTGDVPMIMAENVPIKIKPEANSSQNSAPDVSLFGSPTDQNAVEDSKLKIREEKPILDAALPNQPSKDTLQQPAHSSVMDPNTAPIQSNSASQIFGISKKVTLLQVGPDGRIILNQESTSKDSVGQANPSIQGPQFISGVRIPTPRPNVSIPPHAGAKLSPTQTIPTNSPANLEAQSNSTRPLALNEVTTQKTVQARYGLQLTAQRSSQAAQMAFSDLQARHPSVLKGMKANIVPVDLGERGMFYRVKLGDFPTREEAIQLCSRLKADGGDCIVQPNS